MSTPLHPFGSALDLARNGFRLIDIVAGNESFARSRYSNLSSIAIAKGEAVSGDAGAHEVYELIDLDEAGPMNLVLASGRNVQVPYDSHLLSFGWNPNALADDDGDRNVEGPEFSIRFPFLCEIGMELTDPRTYGFVEFETLQGRALRLDMPDGGYLLLTDGAGAMIPPIADMFHSLLARYDDAGQLVAACSCSAIPEFD